MAIINVLDTSVSNLIAAGEVVERPSNALKELCENSLDAHAKNITVEIKNGGILYFRVTDDGCGMSDEDAILSVKRHATSKIKEADDLNRIMTFGFRGEALAAITSVTDTRIYTKTRENDLGTYVRVEYGELTEVEENGCNDGTTIICEKLFKNTPARLKFLKSDTSEGSLCNQTIERLALSHPEVAFKFIQDGQEKFSTTGDGKLKNAIYSIFGTQFTQKIVEVNSTSGGISVNGYIGTPENFKGNRTNQIFYVNHRLVKNQQMQVALEAAFKTHLMIGKFPVCILNLDINPSYVDVNIHPSKMECKFSDEKRVFDAIYYSVKGVLENKLSRPSLSDISDALSKFNIENNVKNDDKIFKEDTQGYKGEKVSFDSLEENTKEDKKETNSLYEEQKKKLNEDYKNFVSNQTISTDTKTSDNIASNVKKIIDIEYDEDDELPKVKESTDANLSNYEKHDVPDYKIRGELFNIYVVVELENKVILIDKHAAHERINFERMKEQMGKVKPDIQLLLVSDSIILDSYESQMAKDYLDEIKSIGFDIEIDANELIIKGIPEYLDLDEAKDLLSIICESLAQGKGQMKVQSDTFFEKMLYSAACKASIKGNKVYDETHLRWIIDNVFKYDCIKNCPHGRTIGFELTKNELDKYFGRIQD